MAENKLQKQATDFAVEIIVLTKKLKDKKENFISKQIVKSGSMIGENIFEAVLAATDHNKNEFTQRLKNAARCAGETQYWLELLKRTDNVTAEEYDALRAKCESIRSKLRKSVSEAEDKEDN